MGRYEQKSAYMGQHWNDYKRANYYCHNSFWRKVVIYTLDTEIMAFEVYGKNNIKIIDASGEWNSPRERCLKREIILAENERIVSANVTIRKDRCLCFIFLIWNML